MEYQTRQAPTGVELKMTTKDMFRRLFRPVPRLTGKSYRAVDEMLGDLASDEFLRFWNENNIDDMRPIDWITLRQILGKTRQTLNY